MAASYWIKLYHEILDDPKMERLSDHLYRRCMEMFLLAGKTDKGGELPPVEDMAWSFRTTDAAMTEDLQGLAKVGIVMLKVNTWIVTKFAERQAPVEGKERVSRFRERKRKSEYYGETEAETELEEETEAEGDQETEPEAELVAEPVVAGETIGNETCNDSLQRVKRLVTYIRLDKDKDKITPVGAPRTPNPRNKSSPAPGKHRDSRHIPWIDESCTGQSG